MPNKTAQPNAIQPLSQEANKASDYSLTNPLSDQKHQPFADDFNFEHSAFMAAARSASAAGSSDFIASGNALSRAYNLPSCVYLG